MIIIRTTITTRTGIEAMMNIMTKIKEETITGKEDIKNYNRNNQMNRDGGNGGNGNRNRNYQTQRNQGQKPNYNK